MQGTHAPLAPPELLCRLCTTLVGKVQGTLRAEDNGRLRAWRAWLEEAWTSEKGALNRWLKDESFGPPITFLSRPDGTVTANPAKMDVLLQDA